MSILLIHFFSFLSLCLSDTRPPYSIDDDMDQVEMLVAQTNRPYVIFMHANWCTPCKLMEETTLSEDRISTLLDRYYVFAKLDVEKPDGKLMAVLQEVKSFPTVLIFDPNGTLIDRVDHAPSLREMENLLMSHKSPSTQYIRSKPQ